MAAARHNVLVVGARSERSSASWCPRHSVSSAARPSFDPVAQACLCRRSSLSRAPSLPPGRAYAQPRHADAQLVRQAARRCRRRPDCRSGPLCPRRRLSAEQRGTAARCVLRMLKMHAAICATAICLSSDACPGVNPSPRLTRQPGSLAGTSGFGGDGDVASDR